jgi:hypothetical protein
VPCAEARDRAGQSQRGGLAAGCEPCCYFQCRTVSRIGMLLGKNVSTMVYSAMTFQDQHLPRPAFAKSDAAMTTGSIFAARGLK